MTVSEIANKTAESLSFQLLQSALRSGERKIQLHGLAGSLKAFAIAHAKAETSTPLLTVVIDDDQAERLRDDLEAILGEDRVRYFPAWEITPYEERSPHLDVTGLRIEALESLLMKEDVVVVTSVEAMLWCTIPPYVLELSTRSLEVGGTSDLEDLATSLVGLGFERTPMVDGIGQFSVRGGILDVYPFGAEDPLRIEFFGDEVESIREFDIYSQRSVRELRRAQVFPCREVALLGDLVEVYLENIQKAEVEEGVSLEELKEKVEAGLFFEGIEQYLPIIYGEKAGILNYLDEDTLVFTEDPEDIEAKADEVEGEFERLFWRWHREGKSLLPPSRLFIDFDSMNKKLDHFRRVESLAFRPRDENIVEFEARGARQYEGDLRVLMDDLLNLSDDGYEIYILCDNKGQVERLEELLEDTGGLLSIGVGGLHEGFVFPQGRVALINDHEIFSRYHRRHRYRRFKGGIPIPSFTALEGGDFVVHVDHGIGQYQGIQRLNVDGKERDCLLILYRDDDKLYVPVEGLDRVRKYTVEEGVPPALSKLGGTSWEKVKERTRKALFKMAKELIDLYAERKAKSGFAFSPDSTWQRELEASFIYQETPDQLTATEEVKRDLESPTPMDRLVCGDVGYGKTEVAIRAAFKVVCDNKQAAVLAPTTILAEQHHRTFTERLKNFPIRVEVLSRFRTQREQRDVLEGLRSGSVDIVIGTHRLLSDDVQFKDLGLVVIDDEQKFGVVHKERLKKLRRLVEVLTMTATPIPRTLHMSLMGARDMSVINTPPKDRLPIHTEILHFDEDKIAEVILREVDRGGQVFFVHNRVQSIDRMSSFLEELIPQVRFAVAHGQMPERHLDRVMIDFLDRKYDCLVSSMIIESGLDMPNVNTIIINRADRFGLAQLYQLRGRVGRSNYKAFAYLLTPPRQSISDSARKRLRAIEEFSDLGSGFSIAMRDLEIRGAGNILGPQQHGFIAAVGFDLYCRLLDEAVRELKGEAADDFPDPEVEVRVSAYIPDDYISDSGQKVAFYQRLAEVRRSVQVLEIEEELKDRYGRIPPPTSALLNIAHIRLLARQLRLASVAVYDWTLRMAFPPERKLSRKEVQSLIQKAPVPLQFYLGDTTVAEAELLGDDEGERLELAKKILEQVV